MKQNLTSKTHNHSPKSLIRDFSLLGSNDLEDCFLIIAKNIENSLLMVGARPGEDYTYLDLYKLAAPFVLHRFRKKELNYEIAWDRIRD